MSNNQKGRRNDNESNVEDISVHVNVTPNVQSIITQVDRNAPPVQPPKRGPQPLDIDVDNRSVTQKPSRRGLFARLMWCCAADDTLPQNSTTSSTVSSISTNVVTARSRVDSSKRQPNRMPNLPPPPVNQGRKLLALDLDETLVHSSFQPVERASFTISVAIEGIVHNVYVIKRPGCDEFLRSLAEHYEIVVYTASLSKYADPLLDILDPDGLISNRLFREHCVFYDGHYVKDLSLLNRDIAQTIIVDNSPMSYIFHPENAIDCTSFFDDPLDTELWDISDFLIGIKEVQDVRSVCRHWRNWCNQKRESSKKSSASNFP